MEDRYIKILLNKKELIINLLIKKGLVKPEAEDMFQDLYIKIHNKINSGVYNEEGKFEQWMHTVLNNMYLDYHRKKIRRKSYPEKFIRVNGSEIYMESENIEDCSMDIENNIINNEQLEIINYAIKKLKPNQQQVIDMYINKGMKFINIAEDLGESINTILGRYRYAKKNIKRITIRKL